MYESDNDSTRSPPTVEVDDIHVNLPYVPWQEPPQPHVQCINEYPVQELNLPSCLWQVPIYHNNGQTYDRQNDVYQYPEQQTYPIPYQHYVQQKHL